ncbi:MAG: hypothetical protein ABI369_09655 [Acetobacteraceae bacterium]
MSERTKLAGLIGDDIQGSSAPTMHQHEARALGFALTYRTIDFARPKRDPSFLAAMLDAAESLAFSGLNITHPYKQAVVPLLHDLSDDARRIGAVNTVIFSAGKRLGHNTDWSGFADHFTATLPDADFSQVALVAAGGDAGRRDVAGGNSLQLLHPAPQSGRTRPGAGGRIDRSSLDGA